MFALEVEYLTGRAVASQRHDREAAEWPPHPGRLFSALVAAFKEAGFGDAEREALLWLERQPPPNLSDSQAFPRDVVPVFVPVNDDMAPDRVPAKGFSLDQVANGVRVLPERRSRQQRTFPSVTPVRATVHFIWSRTNQEEVEQHRTALARLAASVTYLGHSSSLVRVAISDQPPAATLQPSEIGREVLRVPTPGRLAELEATYQRGGRPSPGMFCAYTRATTQPGEEPPSTVFGEMMVFRRTSGPRLPLSLCLVLTSTVRRALLAKAGPNPLEVLSGHTPDGRPSEQPHVAFVPLANVSLRNPYADGNLMGFAVVLPRRLGGVSDSERRHILRALGQLQRLEMGAAGVWQVEPLTAESPRKSLQIEEYTEPAARWATVTPMLFDCFPKDKPGKDTVAIVNKACERIGLPPPRAVEVGPVSQFRGVPLSGHFQRRRHGQQPHLHRAHLVLEFEKRVRGPIILGAGRYQGLGFCRRLVRYRVGRRLL